MSFIGECHSTPCGWPSSVLICKYQSLPGLPRARRHWTQLTNSLMATGSIFVAALALPEEQSVAGAVFQTLVQLGGSFGLAFTTLINVAISTKSLDAGKTTEEARLDGLHAAFWLGAGCSFGALILAMIMLRGMGAIGKFKKVPKGAQVGEGEKVH
jgi:MFS family permease